MSYDEYSALPGVRWSHLKHMAESPAHYMAAIQQPSADTTALRFGRLLHSMVLEPHTVADTYAVHDLDRRTKAYKEWRAENATKVEVKRPEWDEAEAIAAAVRAHPALVPLFEGATFETAVTWVEDGVECKALLDWYHRGTRTLIDVKTCRSANPRIFAAAVARYGYHGQMAHYEAGAKASGMPVDRVLLVAAEKGAPYDVVVYDITGDTLEAGRRFRDPLLAMVRECEEAGRWPGRSNGTEPLTLPSWADPDMDDPDIIGTEEGA